MRQKRNVKSESEEITIILSEHGKALCQVENERNIDYSFEHGERRSQAEIGRNIELSFCNADLIKASLFRKKYRRIFGYAFSEKSNLFSRDFEKRFRPFARPSPLCFMPNVGRKGLFVRSWPPGRMPLKEELLRCAGHAPKIADKARCCKRRKSIIRQKVGAGCPAPVCGICYFILPFFPGQPMPGKFMSPRRTAASSASAAFW